MTYDDLSFGICWFNDPSIFRLLDSLPKECKKYVIDGKFALNPNRKELSDEKLRDRVKQYENVILIDAPNLSEPEKRNTYLIENPHKYQINIDSDEYVIDADWDRFYSIIQDIEEGIHHIMFKVDDNDGATSYPRLWVNPKDWRYVICHNIFKNEKLGLVLKSGFSDGITIDANVLFCGMDDKLRSEEHLKDTYDYQVEMMKFEKPFREKYRNGDLTPFG